MVLSWSYSLIHGLMQLDYAANLCSAMIRCCTNIYGTKGTHYVTKETQTTDVTSCLVGAMHGSSQGKVTARNLGSAGDLRGRD